MRFFSSQENPSRLKLQKFLEKASTSIPSGSKVLDAGAGEGMYRTLFEKMKYVSVDLCKVSKAYGRISIISDLLCIPFVQNSFDMIICTQVLEHVCEPKIVLDEFARVLKPKGTIWISVPFFFEQHEIPYDYYRYTFYGLTHLVEASKFRIKQISWLDGYYGALAYQLNTAARFFKEVKANYPLAMLFKSLARYCNNKEKMMVEVANDQPYIYGKNLILVAEKPD